MEQELAREDLAEVLDLEEVPAEEVEEDWAAVVSAVE